MLILWLSLLFFNIALKTKRNKSLLLLNCYYKCNYITTNTCNNITIKISIDEMHYFSSIMVQNLPYNKTYKCTDIITIWTLEHVLGWYWKYILERKWDLKTHECVLLNPLLQNSERKVKELAKPLQERVKDE